jgi:hypothetical protein
MTNLHLLDGADPALSLLDRAHSLLLAAHASAELDGQTALAADLRVLLAALAAEADALFETWLREIQRR